MASNTIFIALGILEDILEDILQLQLLNKWAYMTMKQQLNTTAPQEPQTYRFKKLTEIKAYLLDEMKFRELFAKKMNRFNTTTSIVNTNLITSTVITGGISIATFPSGVGLPVGITINRTNVLLSLATVITQKSFKTFKLLAQSKWDSIANIISQAMQDGDTSSIRFHKVLQDVEKYRKLQVDIRNQSKAKVKQITKEQREELLEKWRKEGKEDFLRKIANTSGIQGVGAI